MRATPRISPASALPRGAIATNARTKAGTSSPPCVSRQASHGRRPLRQRERNSLVKKRMREIRTSRRPRFRVCAPTDLDAWIARGVFVAVATMLRLRTSTCRATKWMQACPPPKRSNPYEQCERRRGRFHQSIARRSPLARRTPGRSHPDHRVARHPRGQKRALDPNDAVPCVHVPRSGGSRDGGSASARVLHRAPDRPADALVRAILP